MIYKIIFIMIILLSIVCILFCTIRITTLTKNMKRKVNDLFTYEMAPMSYDSKNEIITLQNKYNCNLETLRECNMDDPITIMGCKEFAVRCFHVDRDISYMNEGEVFLRIPKNKSPREGYVLAITDLTTSCNPYHGDLVIISSNLRSNEYLLICNCKNPGYIGNDVLMGSCESVRVCNGQVVDINKPLDQIECLCKDSEISTRAYQSDVPVCAQKTINEANEKYNDWSSLLHWGDRDTISTDTLTLEYKTHLPDRILNPCTHSITDTSISIPNAHYDKEIGSCRFHDYGIPFSIGLFSKPYKNGDGPTTVLDCAMHTRLPYQFVRVTGRVDGNKSVLAINVDAKTVVVLPDEKDRSVGVGDCAQIMITTKPKVFFAPRCAALESMLSYSCYVGNHYDIMENGLPRAKTEPHPFLYAWGYEHWDRLEIVSGNSALSYSNEGVRIADPKNFLMAGESMAAYGVIFGREESGILSFEDKADYRIHEQASF